MLGLIIGILIIVVVGQILFWIIAKVCQDERLALPSQAPSCAGLFVSDHGPIASRSSGILLCFGRGLSGCEMNPMYCLLLVGSFTAL